MLSKEYMDSSAATRGCPERAYVIITEFHNFVIESELDTGGKPVLLGKRVRAPEDGKMDKDLRHT